MDVFASCQACCYCSSALAPDLFFAASPASASIGYIFGPSPTTTPVNLWAYAEVPKPTHTSTPLVLPTDTAVPATETPGTLAMQIIDDTPVPTQPAVQQAEN